MQTQIKRNSGGEMNMALFVLGLVLALIFLYLVFGWKLKEHQNFNDSLYEDEMYKDAESRGK